MKILMIDNYDSFTYNIVQYFGELGADVQTFRNDEITVEEIEASGECAVLSQSSVGCAPRGEKGSHRICPRHCLSGSLAKRTIDRIAECVATGEAGSQRFALCQGVRHLASAGSTRRVEQSAYSTLGVFEL